MIFQNSFERISCLDSRDYRVFNGNNDCLSSQNYDILVIRYGVRNRSVRFFHSFPDRFSDEIVTEHNNRSQNYNKIHIAWRFFGVGDISQIMNKLPQETDSKPSSQETVSQPSTASSTHYSILIYVCTIFVALSIANFHFTPIIESHVFDTFTSKYIHFIWFYFYSHFLFVSK